MEGLIDRGLDDLDRMLSREGRLFCDAMGEREMGGKQEWREVPLAARRRAGECALIAKWGDGRCTISKTKKSVPALGEKDPGAGGLRDSPASQHQVR